MNAFGEPFRAPETIMPLYFFHSDGVHPFRDEDGTELKDTATARREGVRFAAALLDETPEILVAPDHRRLLVTDESGATLMTVEMHTTVETSVVEFPRQPAR